jgi:DNA-binding transcriptional MocR family regulator
MNWNMKTNRINVKIINDARGGKGSPLYRQLGDEIIRKIEAGEILANEKLPPIRTLAAELKVNNTTVVNAYKYLEQKNAAYSIPGSGIFAKAVNQPLRGDFSLESPAGIINLAATSTDPALFPGEDFKNAFDAVLARDGAGAFADVDLCGYEPLRGIFGEPENVMVIPSAQAGVEIVADALLNPGDVVFAEKPCSQAVSAVFTSRGVRVSEFLPDTLFGLAKKFKP